MAETRSTCPYCGVGCGVLIESNGNGITGVRGDPDHPANFGRLCSKGSTLHLTATASITRQVRLLRPMQRAARGQPPQPIAWEAALDQAAHRIADVVQRHGSDAIGIYASGQLLTEDYYVFNKLAKGLLGTNNIDTNSRLCMSSAVAAYKQTLGADAPPACYADVDHADTLFIAGSNTAWAHPVLYRRIEDAKRARPELKIVVADPRRTETAAAADLHLRLLPGSDIALFHGLLHVMLWEGLIDHAFVSAHTAGFEALRDRVRDYTPKETARLTGVPEADVVQAARWFGQQHRPGGATLSLYCQGLNQSSSGTAKNAALINLHLATGQIGRRGAGPFSLTGQPNAMGGREVGGMANLLSGHRDLADAADRAEIEALWGLDRVGQRLSARPGRTAVEMFQAAADGEIRLLWIVCTNPAQSMPDQAMVRRALQRAEFVIVQEAFATTATAAHADLLLPASSWGEKDGTVTNSERRISRVRPAIAPPGEARADWRIAADIAGRIEATLYPGRTTLFPYDDAESVWREHRETTRGRDLDITGLDWPLLDRLGPQCWPMPQGAAAGRERLYEDRRFPTPDGRARFADVAPRPLAEPRDARFPFSLTTGRLRDQWHGMSRTGTIGRLFGHVDEPAVDLHPADMARLSISEGDLVRLTSRRGSLVLPARAADAISPMQAFIAMHWGEEYVTGRSADGQVCAGVNALTTGASCPTSRQPELKHTAVRLARAELPWRLVALAWDADALDRRERLKPLMQSLPFAACVPFGRDRSGLLFRAAANESPDDAWLRAFETRFGLRPDDAGLLRYVDRRGGQRRTMRLARDGQTTRLEAFVLVGDIRAEEWLKPLLQEALPADRYGRLLLAPGAAAPIELTTRGRQVCSCLDVAEPDIVSTLAACAGSTDERVAQLQRSLKCGTQCGSCLPELRRLARSASVPA